MELVGYTQSERERQVIIIQEVQVDRQVPKGGAAKGGGGAQSQPINHMDKNQTAEDAWSLPKMATQ